MKKNRQKFSIMHDRRIFIRIFISTSLSAVSSPFSPGFPLFLSLPSRRAGRKNAPRSGWDIVNQAIEFADIYQRLDPLFGV